MSRVLEPAGIIQAWGDLSDPAQRGRTIIDSLMNMPLLYWASRGRPGTAGTATPRRGTRASCATTSCGPTTRRSTRSTGIRRRVEPLRGATEQGHADDSCWARGQAWGIYGFALNYRHTGDASLLDAARRCADYFLDHLPRAASRTGTWRSGTAPASRGTVPRRAIAASGLDELASAARRRSRRGSLPHGGRDRSSRRSRRTTRTDGATRGNALIERGVYDAPKNVGVDEGTLWGDYFYLEALLRVARPDWESVLVSALGRWRTGAGVRLVTFDDRTGARAGALSTAGRARRSTSPRPAPRGLPRRRRHPRRGGEAPCPRGRGAGPAGPDAADRLDGVRLSAPGARPRGDASASATTTGGTGRTTARRYPTYPDVFAKTAEHRVGPDDAIALPPGSGSGRLRGRARGGRSVAPRTRVAERTRSGYVAGYTVVNDVSERDCAEPRQPVGARASPSTRSRRSARRSSRRTRSLTRSRSRRAAVNDR